MMWVVENLHSRPELAVFLTLSIGFLIGNFKIGSFKLGSVTGVLLTGVLVGQIGIVVSSVVQNIFFLMFLFAVGYNSGPQFFSSLKREGMTQVFFAITVCLVGVVTSMGMSKLLGYHIGEAAGLAAGALTQSATIGISQDVIANLDVSASVAKEMSDMIPAGYAVTYIFGAAGLAFLLSTVLPKWFKVDLAKECAEIEANQKKMKLDEVTCESVPTQKIETDIAFIGFAIVSGAMVGFLTIQLDDVVLSLSTSGGVLLAGLLSGYLNNRNPKRAHIPKEVVWLLQNLGLTAFIAVVGINAGKGFIAGLQELGITFFIAGILVTSLTAIIGALVGKYIFKWPLSMSLGVICGAMTATPSLGAISEKANSSVPVIAYTVPYVIGNIFITLWGTILPLLF